MSNQSSCIFCKIISGALPAQIIHDDQEILVIKDIAPKAPIHYLIIPKKHITSLNELEPHDALLTGTMLFTAQKIAQEHLTANKSFRLIVNNGSHAGQSVFHLHCHFLAGKQMSDF